MIYGFVIIIIVIIFFCFFKRSKASERTSVIFICLSSDIAGCSFSNRSRLITHSRNIEFADDVVSDPFEVTYFNRRRYFGTYKSGKTYLVHFVFKAAEGYRFPACLSQNDLRISCDAGSEVTHCQLVHRTTGAGDTLDLFEVEANITVKRKGLFR